KELRLEQLREQSLTGEWKSRRLRADRAVKLLPRTDPRLVEIACLIVRVVQEDSRLFGRIHCCLESKPERPMRGVKTADEKVGDARRLRPRFLGGLAIDPSGQGEAARLQQFA